MYVLILPSFCINGLHISGFYQSQMHSNLWFSLAILATLEVEAEALLKLGNSKHMQHSEKLPKNNLKVSVLTVGMLISFLSFLKL